VGGGAGRPIKLLNSYISTERLNNKYVIKIVIYLLELAQVGDQQSVGAVCNKGKRGVDWQR
jgi:hypothetical protein